MPDIGFVTRTPAGGFKGELRTVSIRAEIEILPNEQPSRARPDYRVVAGDLELGAGWNRRSEFDGFEYVSLSIAAPEFGPRRLYVTLAPVVGESPDSFSLLWIPAD